MLSLSISLSFYVILCNSHFVFSLSAFFLTLFYPLFSCSICHSVFFVYLFPLLFFFPSLTLYPSVFLSVFLSIYLPILQSTFLYLPHSLSISSSRSFIPLSLLHYLYLVLARYVCSYLTLFLSPMVSIFNYQLATISTTIPYILPRFIVCMNFTDPYNVLILTMKARYFIFRFFFLSNLSNFSFEMTDLLDGLFERLTSNSSEWRDLNP